MFRNSEAWKQVTGTEVAKGEGKTCVTDRRNCTSLTTVNTEEGSRKVSSQWCEPKLAYRRRIQTPRLWWQLNVKIFLGFKVVPRVIIAETTPYTAAEACCTVSWIRSTCTKWLMSRGSRPTAPVALCNILDCFSFWIYRCPSPLNHPHLTPLYTILHLFKAICSDSQCYSA